MNYSEEALKKHAEWHGKIKVEAKVPLNTKDELSLAYTPGVAAACLKIQDEPSLSFKLTARSNLCLVVTDGTAVLGLGDIGPEAAMPVMEGKCALFKRFGNVDAFPLCVNTKDVDEIVETIYRISDSFGGINLEDISAPRCFEIEEKLKAKCSVPVFHDDQHGTAVVVLAGLRNALKLKNKNPKDTKVVINGAGAAGIAVTKLLLKAGFGNVILCDKHGVLNKNDPYLKDYPHWLKIAELTNPDNISGGLADALREADVFAGFSAPRVLSPDLVPTMAKEPVIFACANPEPEIDPKAAKESGAFIVATGRSDMPNQINNLLAFPGIFRGAFDSEAFEINEDMKLAASNALADLITEGELCPEYIIPDPFDERILPAVSTAVAKAAHESGVVRK